MPLDGFFGIIIVSLVNS